MDLASSSLGTQFLAGKRSNYESFFEKAEWRSVE